MDKQKGQPHYDYNYYAQMGFNKGPSQTKPDQKGNNNNSVLSKSPTANTGTSNNVSNAVATTASSTAYPYNMTQEQYYNYYTSYYNYYNQYYQYYNQTQGVPTQAQTDTTSLKTDSTNEVISKNESNISTSNSTAAPPTGVCQSQLAPSGVGSAPPPPTGVSCIPAPPKEPYPTPNPPADSGSTTPKHGSGLLPDPSVSLGSDAVPAPPSVPVPPAASAPVVGVAATFNMPTGPAPGVGAQGYPAINYAVPPPMYYPANSYYNYQGYSQYNQHNKNLQQPSQQQQEISPKSDKISRFQPQQQKTNTPANNPDSNTKAIKTPLWPEPLKNYVQRAFNSVLEQNKDKMQELLKVKLESVYSNELVNKIDWENEPLPKFDLGPNESITSSTPTETAKKGYGLRKPLVFTPEINKPTAQNRGKAGFRRDKRATSSSSCSSSHHRHHNNRSRSPPAHRRQFTHRKRSRSKSSSTHRSSSPDSSMSNHNKKKQRRFSTESSDRRKSSMEHPSPHKERRYDGARTVKPAQQYERNYSGDAPLNITVNNTPDSNSMKGFGNRRGGRNRFNKKNRAIQQQHQQRQHQNQQNQQRQHQNQQNQKQPQNRQHRGGMSAVAEMDPEKLAERASRFKDHLLRVEPLLGEDSVTGSVDCVDGGDEWDAASSNIVGTCQTLDKRYLRLTRAPESSEVRPPDVLVKSLEYARNLWYVDKRDYRYVCEQFKSIRQDLTVQCIRDQFTLTVYKTHATVALDAGDHEEFNQCQSQIKLLYEEGIPCSDLLEFTAYRLLYYMFTRDFLNINTTLAMVHDNRDSNPCLDFALKLRAAWSVNDNLIFFKLACPIDSSVVPKSCAKIVGWFLERERKGALKSIVKAYRPFLETNYLSGILGYQNNEDLLEFLSKLMPSEDSLDTIFVTGENNKEKIDMKVLCSILQI